MSFATPSPFRPVVLYDVPPQQQQRQTFNNGQQLSTFGHPPPPYSTASTITVTTLNNNHNQNSKRNSWADLIAESDGTASINSRGQDVNMHPMSHYDRQPLTHQPNNYSHNQKRKSWANIVGDADDLHNVHATGQTPRLKAIQNGELRDFHPNGTYDNSLNSQQSSNMNEFILAPSSQLKLYKEQQLQNQQNDVKMSNKLSFLHAQPNYKCLLFTTASLAILLIAASIGFIVAAHLQAEPKMYSFQWFPPRSATTNRPNSVNEPLIANFVMLPSTQTVAVQAFGDDGWPFASTSTIIDYNMGHTVSIDKRLPDYCIVVPHDDQTNTFQEMLDAAEQTSQSGYRSPMGTWLINTNWRVTVVSDEQRRLYTYEQMSECGNGTVILLQADNNVARCSPKTCSEFCVPSFGVDSFKHVTLQSRHCFQLFVPEWRKNASKDPKTNRLLLDAFYQGLASQQMNPIYENAFRNQDQAISADDNWVRVGSFGNNNLG